ncbi:hypothetical protein OG985_28375 [Streptomyces sp. NBC_00289]|uniref:DUF7848 domain-containing protein n=1 Tax=Streptomyces sp. NBC_00289 TaxID=2975703 RepID=UPI00324EC798
MRSVFRFVDYTINHVPEGGVIWEAHCGPGGCDWSAQSDSDEETSKAAIRHTAETGHNLFRRTVSDHASVMPVESAGTVLPHRLSALEVPRLPRA